MSNVLHEAQLQSASQASFSLNTVLGAKSQVYYEQIFNTKHVGRVTDLFLFETYNVHRGWAERPKAEARFRSIFQQAMFFAWEHYRSKENTKLISLETGFDETKLAFSIEFLVEKDMQKFSEENPTALLQSLIRIQAQADGMIVRHKLERGALQVVFFVDMGEAKSGLETPSLPKLLYFPLDKTVDDKIVENQIPDPTLPLSAASHHKAFLVDEKKEKPSLEEKREKSKAPSLALVPKPDIKNVPGAETVEVEADTRVESDQSVDDSVQIILALLKKNLEETTIHPDKKREFLTVVKKDIEENFEQTIKHITEVYQIDVATKIQGYKEEVATLTARLKTLENAEPEKNSVTKQADYEVLVAKNIAADKRFSEDIKHHQKILNTDKVNDSARVWAKGFMEDLLKDRSELNERVKAVDSFLRKREHEFRISEAQLVEQIRKKDEILKQRELMLKKTKDALSLTLKDTQKTDGQPSQDQEVKALKQKVQVMEKNLDVYKKGSEKLMGKMEELQRRLTVEVNAKALLQKEIALTKKDLSSSDAMKPGAAVAAGSKTEELLKKTVDTLKQQNRELQAKAVLGVESTRQLRIIKEELDRNKKALEETKKEELRLKGETAKLQGVVRALEKEKAAAIKK